MRQPEINTIKWKPPDWTFFPYKLIYCAFFFFSFFLGWVLSRVGPGPEKFCRDGAKYREADNKRNNIIMSVIDSAEKFCPQTIMCDDKSASPFSGGQRERERGREGERERGWNNTPRKSSSSGRPQQSVVSGQIAVCVCVCVRDRCAEDEGYTTDNKASETRARGDPPRPVDDLCFSAQRRRQENEINTTNKSLCARKNTRTYRVRLMNKMHSYSTRYRYYCYNNII